MSHRKTIESLSGYALLLRVLLTILNKIMREMQYAGNNRDQDKCGVDTGTAVASSDLTHHVTLRSRTAASQAAAQATPRQPSTSKSRLQKGRVSWKSAIDGKYMWTVKVTAF